MCQCALAAACAALPSALKSMHPDTIAALRLLVLALEAHSEDLETLQIYGDLPEHLADVIADYIDEDED